MGNPWIPHFDSSSTSPSSTRPSSPEIAQNTSNEGMHSGTGSAFSTRLDEVVPNGQILITTPNLWTSTSAELETATRNSRPDTVLTNGRFSQLFLPTTSHVRETLLLSRKWSTSTSATRRFYRRKEGEREREREMENLWKAPSESSSTSPSSTRHSSPGIAQNTSNDGMHLGTGSAFSTHFNEVSANGQILTTPNLRTFTFAALKTVIRNFWPDMVLGGGHCGQESCLFRRSLLRQSLRLEESPKNLLVPFLSLHIYRSLDYLCFTTTNRFARKSFEHFKHSNICSIECTREYEAKDSDEGADGLPKMPNQGDGDCCMYSWCFFDSAGRG